MIKSAALLLVLSVILCHFSAEADPSHNPPSNGIVYIPRQGHRMRRGMDMNSNPDGIVSIRERRGEVRRGQDPPHRMRRGMDMNSNPDGIVSIRERRGEVRRGQDPPHRMRRGMDMNSNPDGIVSIRERRGEVRRGQDPPHRMRRGMDMNSDPRPYGGR